LHQLTPANKRQGLQGAREQVVVGVWRPKLIRLKQQTIKGKIIRSESMSPAPADTILDSKIHSIKTWTKNDN